MFWFSLCCFWQPPIYQGLCQTQVLNSLAELKCTSLVRGYTTQCRPELLVRGDWSFQWHLLQKYLEQEHCDWYVGNSLMSETGFKKRIKKLQAQVDWVRQSRSKLEVVQLVWSTLWEPGNRSKRRLLKVNGLAGRTQSHTNLSQLSSVC